MMARPHSKLVAFLMQQFRSAPLPPGLAGCIVETALFDYHHQVGFAVEQQQPRRGLAVAAYVADLEMDIREHGHGATIRQIMQILSDRLGWVRENWTPDCGVVKWPSTASVFDYQQQEPFIDQGAA